MAGIILRGTTWHFRWVVPEEFRAIVNKKEIHRSLKTDSRSEAEARARDYERELRARYEAVLAGKASLTDGMEAFSAAVRIARGLGIPYRSAKELAEGRIEDILTRVETAQAISSDASDPGTVAAVLGGIEKPLLRLSQLADHVDGLAKDENRFKNETQLRKWRNGNKRTLTQAIEAIGSDLLVQDFNAEHAMKHLLWLEKRVARKEISAETVKKELTYAASCIKRYYRAAGVAHPPRPYAGLSVSKGVAKISHKPKDQKRKRELSVDWILQTLLAPGTLDGLNPEARDILLICVETGCRQSEIYNTPLADIHVEAPHPYFELRPTEGARELKNSASERSVPLVGIALSAMKRVVKRGGFKAYNGKDSWSAAVNKYLRERGAMPDGHTIGGLRHAWEGRMRRAGIAIDDRGVMMGHSVALIRDREEYGDITLAERHSFAQRVALDIADPVAHLDDRVITAPRKRQKAAKEMPCEGGAPDRERSL
ncbi:tyrosine-type recombinase/integrase [Paracoccus sp. S-4012]|uniref:DUF6538 domain-containing protein n=1 Tax=Paracoccus sp. S-4012 TaxID=2665648 RepID=UPI0012B10AEF|nr:DUF6538 domain-containing protein [Paracoccus sp. S-4012]MRX49458.1 tyrosine-type recombinase/integrase [Paracoccus sp. S-4012]